MTTMLRSGLYAITDPELLPGERLLSGVEAALRGGAVLVQYRDKLTPAALRRERARSLLALCRDYGCPLVVNDDVALALAIGADGVHLGQGDSSLEEARRAFGSDRLVGATCHSSMDLARAAAASGCDYVAFGRFFSSQTKQQAPAAPLSILASARRLGLPVTAIGGITLDNAGTVVAAGADLLAVIHGLFSATDIEARAREFTQLIQDTRADRGATTKEPVP
jgi:thiamine-phosphate pyrophosphorylase